MSRSHRTITAALGAILLPAALTAAEPRLDSLTVEGRIPLANVLPNPAAAAMPQELIDAIQANQVEARLRVHYNPASKILRILGIAISTKTAFPTPSVDQLPDRVIGMDFDLSIEHLYWNQTPSNGKPQWTLFAVGRRTAVRKSPYTSGDHTVIQIVFDDGPNGKIGLLSISTGPFVALATDAAGSVKLSAADGH